MPLMMGKEKSHYDVEVETAENRVRAQVRGKWAPAKRLLGRAQNDGRKRPPSITERTQWTQTVTTRPRYRGGGRGRKIADKLILEEP